MNVYGAALEGTTGNCTYKDDHPIQNVKDACLKLGIAYSHHMPIRTNHLH